MHHAIHVHSQVQYETLICDKSWIMRYEEKSKATLSLLVAFRRILIVASPSLAHPVSCPVGAAGRTPALDLLGPARTKGQAQARPFLAEAGHRTSVRSAALQTEAARAEEGLGSGRSTSLGGRMEEEEAG